jgi:hypothetical protein
LPTAISAKKQHELQEPKFRITSSVNQDLGGDFSKKTARITRAEIQNYKSRKSRNGLVPHVIT